MLSQMPERCHSIRSFARGVFARLRPAWSSGRQPRSPDELCTLLPCLGPPHPDLQDGAPTEPGRHDFLRLQCASLADDRSWTADHRIHAVAYMRSFSDLPGGDRRGTSAPSSPKAEERVSIGQVGEDHPDRIGQTGTPVTIAAAEQAVKFVSLTDGSSRRSGRGSR